MIKPGSPVDFRTPFIDIVRADNGQLQGIISDYWQRRLASSFDYSNQLIQAEKIAPGAVTSVALNLAAKGWTQTCAFTVTDADTVSWGSGTFTASDGTSYAINAGNTGNMAALTYIYLDIDVSVTAYQVTTSAPTAVGDNKVLIGIAQNHADEATFQIFGGSGGITIAGENVVANSITGNELSTSIVYAGTIVLSTSGNIRSGQTAYDTGTGFWLGNDGGTPKFSIGDSTARKLTWDGAILTVDGALVARSGSVVDGQYLTANTVISSKLNLAARGWTQTSVFSVTDSDTVSWGAGTFTASDGTAYAIGPGNTGNMAALTYIYLDIAISTTAYQSTTVATNAVGDGKVLIAIAQNHADEATFQVFGGSGGLTIAGENIVALSITGNEIAASTITAGKLSVTELAAITTNTGTLIIASGGYLRSGQTAYDTGTGFYLGNDGGTPKFSIGNSAGDKLTWSGSVLTVTGAITGGTITGTTFKTATSGERVEIDSTNGVRFYNSGGTLVGQLKGSTYNFDQEAINVFGIDGLLDSMDIISKLNGGTGAQIAMRFTVDSPYSTTGAILIGDGNLSPTYVTFDPDGIIMDSGCEIYFAGKTANDPKLIKDGNFTLAIQKGNASTRGNLNLAALDASGDITVGGITTVSGDIIYWGSGAASGVRARRNASGSIIFETGDGIGLATLTASMKFGTHTAIGSETVTGYITIQDEGGTSRKLAVLS